MPPSLPEAPARHLFRLKFHNHGKDLARDMEFVASGFSEALKLAAEATGGRSTELWLDGQPLCRLKPLGGEAWEVAALARAHSPPLP